MEKNSQYMAAFRAVLIFSYNISVFLYNQFINEYVKNY